MDKNDQKVSAQPKLTSIVEALCYQVKANSELIDCFRNKLHSIYDKSNIKSESLEDTLQPINKTDTVSLLEELNYYLIQNNKQLKSGLDHFNEIV